MNSERIIIVVIVVLIGIVVAMDIYNKRKLKKQIKNQWGTFPSNSRYDAEKPLKKSFEKLRTFNDNESFVDEITWNDLDMFSIFEELNHTYSSIGSEALYKRLRLFDLNDLDQTNLEELITYYKNNEDKREAIQYIFAKLGKQDHNSVIDYLTSSQKSRPAYLSFFIFLGLLPLLGLLLLFTAYSNIGVIVLIGSIMFNVIYSQSKKASLDSELNSMSYLVRCLGSAKEVAKINHPLSGKLETLLTPFRSILYLSYFFRFKGSGEAEIIIDYLNMLFMLPFIAYHFAFNRIKHYEKEAIQLWELLGNLEVAYAILNYRKVLTLSCQPEFISENKVLADKLYHPLIEEPVANPVDWNRNTLVSGSNASGKSTYVKSLAINCILAQTIYTCTANSFSLKRGHVMTSMAVEDNVHTGDSYFIAEIKSLKRIMEKVMMQEQCYCFVDEILRGTNTIERVAASSSIIEWFSKYQSLAFVATHDIELTEMLKAKCTNVHFQEKVTSESGVSFDFKLRSGPATTRNALQLLQVMEFPTDVVAHAKEKAQHFDETRSWAYSH